MLSLGKDSLETEFLIGCMEIFTLYCVFSKLLSTFSNGRMDIIINFNEYINRNKTLFCPIDINI